MRTFLLAEDNGCLLLLQLQRLMKAVSPIIFSILLGIAGHIQAADQPVLRVGHFPNITHAQALVAHNLSRQGKGWFEERLGPGTKIEWFVYNAGPSAMEAIFAKSIDLTYVGPGPALNAYTKSNGAEVRLDRGCGQRRRSAGCATGPKSESAGGFSGKENRDPAVGKHAGYFLSRMVDGGRPENHAARR